MTWNPWGLVGILAGAVALVAAVFIHRTAPDPRVRRRVPVLLFFEALMVLSSGAGVLLWLVSERLAWAGGLFHYLNDCLLLATYLPAVAVVVDSPLVRPFRRGPGLWLVVALGVGGAVLALLRPGLFVGDPALVEVWGRPVMAVAPGPAWPWIAILLSASYTWGLLATVLHWVRADNPVDRRRSGALSLAFGTRDLFWAGVFLFVALRPDTPAGFVYQLVQLSAVALAAYVVLMAYGIASAHLFDIDLRVKWTLEKGTVAAIFVAVFFVVSEGAASILSDRLGTVVGLLATGGLVFLLAPLQRASEALVGAAMPAVADTPEYREFRKEQIYAEAVSEALQDGVIPPVGRAILDRLRQTLELDAAAARELEAELMAPRPRSPGSSPS